jgi:ribosomal protein L40E
MKICRKCGATNSFEGKFCYNCGELLEVEQPTLVCAGCSSVNSSSSKFCFKCGRTLKNDIIFCNSCGAKNSKADIYCVSCKERIVANAGEPARTLAPKDLPRKEINIVNEKNVVAVDAAKITRKEYDNDAAERTTTIQNIINVEPSKADRAVVHQEKANVKKTKTLPQNFKSESATSSRFKIFFMLLLFGGLTAVLFFLPFFNVSGIEIKGYDIIAVFVNKISALILKKPLITNLSLGGGFLSTVSAIDICVIISIIIVLIIIATSLYNGISALSALFRLAANKNYKKSKSKLFLLFILNAVVCGALYAFGNIAALKPILQSSNNGIFGIEATMYYYIFTAGLLLTLIMSAVLKKKRQ